MILSQVDPDVDAGSFEKIVSCDDCIVQESRMFDSANGENDRQIRTGVDQGIIESCLA